MWKFIFEILPQCLLIGLGLYLVLAPLWQRGTENADSNLENNTCQGGCGSCSSQTPPIFTLKEQGSERTSEDKKC